MNGKLVTYRDGEFPVRFSVLLYDRGQPAFLEQTRTGIAKDVHLEPGFTGLVNIQPPVGFAGIKEELPFAAFTGDLARFDSFDSAHRIDLSSAMSFVCCFESFRPFRSCQPWIRTTDGSIVRRAGGPGLYRRLTTRRGHETFPP